MTNNKLKCKCGVELFESDLVDIESEFHDTCTGTSHTPLSDMMTNQPNIRSRTYRCPKCFKTKKVKL